MLPDQSVKQPTLFEALIPIAALVALLSASVYFFADNSSYGPNQVALILAAGIGILIGVKNGMPWKQLESGIVQGVSLAVPPILILLAVGSLIGTWIMAGIVPTMIYFGLQIMDPSLFYFSACIMCAIVSMVIGSSWTTAGTIGIALIGISTALGLSLPITAGAIISGAYFGDKLSPLSETTNLAPAVAGTDLFTHIRHMLWTTVPSIAIALLLFLAIGINTETGIGDEKIAQFLGSIESNFAIGWYLLLPVLLLFYMVMKKMPAFPAIFIAALLGGVFAIVFQPDVVVKFADSSSLPTGIAMLKGVWMSLFQGFSASTGVEEIDSLLSRGGMEGMMNTVWLIISAMVFGGVMETTQILQRITHSILQFAQSSRSLILSTLATCIGTNIITSDQYISIILPGRMYQLEFKNLNLANKNLSRALEDGGTVTSVLIPWNTCGAYMSSTLGVATFAYLPFAFFNLISPIISAIYAITGFTIAKADEQEQVANTQVGLNRPAQANS